MGYLLKNNVRIFFPVTCTLKKGKEIRAEDYFKLFLRTINRIMFQKLHLLRIHLLHIHCKKMNDAKKTQRQFH